MKKSLYGWNVSGTSGIDTYPGFLAPNSRIRVHVVVKTPVDPRKSTIVHTRGAALTPAQNGDAARDYKDHRLHIRAGGGVVD